MAKRAGVITGPEITAGLVSLGLAKGDVVLVHSSLSSLGHVEGGADAVIDAIIAAVGPSGTVAFPTLTGSAGLGPDNPPVFRPHLDPCWTGTIPQTARQRPQFIRSLGPTHSVCATGARARWLTEGHERATTPCGEGSPYHKLSQADGKVLFIGVTLACNTLCHHVEEMAGAPYVCVDDPVAAKVLLSDGTRIDVPLRIHAYGTPRNYPKLERELIERRMLAIGKAGQAEVRLLWAKPFCDLMIPRTAQDPAVLLA